jgi:hypothetical protein
MGRKPSCDSEKGAGGLAHSTTFTRPEDIHRTKDNGRGRNSVSSVPLWPPIGKVSDQTAQH